MKSASKKSSTKPKPASKAKPTGSVEVWGIMTCNSTRKALKLYENGKVPYKFKDFKTTVPPKTLLHAALKSVDNPRKLFNTSGKAYQEGNYKTKVETMKKDEIIEEMVKNPMLIKRPVVRTGKGVVVGFDESALKEIAK